MAGRRSGGRNRKNVTNVYCKNPFYGIELFDG